jgi:hypothetical protein
VHRSRIRAVLLLIAVAVGTGCEKIEPDVHSSAANASAGSPTVLSESAATSITSPITVSTPSTTSEPLPGGWRGPAQIDALLATVATPSHGLSECLAGSPYGNANDDAAVLACLDDEAARSVYGVTMFERSDSVPMLADIPQGLEEFQDCISTALSSELIYDRLVEIATTARYWGPDRHGDEVATDVIDRQFGSCWQTLALG